MSTTAAHVINAISGIERLRYLELGICGGGTFARVRAGEKVGVDHAQYEDGCRVDFLMSTDSFFAGPGRGRRFDVVFIDACHDFPNVFRDFNHSVAALDPGGIVLLHDLVPPDPAHTSPSLCSDAFRLLHLLLTQPRTGLEVVVQAGDYGLTAVRGARPVALPTAAATLEELLAVLETGPVRPVSLEDMVATVVAWRNGGGST